MIDVDRAAAVSVDYHELRRAGGGEALNCRVDFGREKLLGEIEERAARTAPELPIANAGNALKIRHDADLLDGLRLDGFGWKRRPTRIRGRQDGRG